MTNPEDYIAALINLHRGLDRQGPGDEAFSRRILSELPELPPGPRIADLGCGTGAGALLLAEWFHSHVLAVDMAQAFVEELRIKAQQRGLDHLIMTLEADMGTLDWPEASIDLLWSEGAAYNLGFERALQLWRPLVAENGLAVISEMSWFTSNAPAPAKDFWKVAYPAMAGEEQNLEQAGHSGFSIVNSYRLPSQAWWDNYYNPLKLRIASLRSTADHVMQTVIHETETEMSLFEQYSESYGYTFYVLRATPVSAAQDAF
ncbi:MAG: class I SAM-dependent methyltransferase [Bacteroidota bacterium]|jgi:SAM-dependent methyltransferase